jgi:hypothetical protein
MSLSPTASFDFSLPTRVYAGACARLGTDLLLVTAPELKAASDKVVADFAAKGTPNPFKTSQWQILLSWRGHVRVD